MFLIHGRVGAIQHIMDKLFAIRQSYVLAVDVTRAFLVHLKKKAPKISSPNVHVLPNFKITVSAQHKQPPVPPGSQAIRRKLVNADVARSMIASQHHITEIFQARILRMVQVADLRSHNFGFC